MKPKKFEKKLSLVKRTIANLTQAELHALKAGFATETLNPSFWDTCNLSAGCQTFCLSNCNTYEVEICQPCDSTPFCQ